jgi:hypothetical protein
MARVLAQHSANDRALALEEGTGLAHLRVIGQFATITDSGSVATGMLAAVGLFGNGKLKGRINGRATIPASVDTTAVTTSNGNLTMGASGSTTEFARGGMRHLIVTQGLTTHEIMQLEGWLLWDVGRPDLLPGDHPYRNIRP